MANLRPASMPEIFGRYELLTRIGVGGMAEVFRARIRDVPAGAEKILVIKRILPSLSSDPEFIALFVNEAKIALPLTHGNITSTFEFGEVAGQHYLAMEYIHGQNAAAIFDHAVERRAPIPVEAALFIAAELAKGLAYAHGFTSPRGDRIEVVHLDVSPQNVLVSYDGAIKLTDFGIAKLRKAAPSEEALVRGKANYFAPEQLEAGRPVDGRADVFSLGCVLYALLTLRRPFEAATDEETLERIRDGHMVPASTWRPELAPLEPILARALATDPDDRFARAEDLHVALSRHLFERAPGYGSSQLGAWMRDVFAWEIFEERAEDDDPLRDRLLFQLSHAQVELPAGSSTDELLQLPTVSIPPPPPLGDAPAPSRAGLRFAVGAGLAALALGAVLMAVREETPSEVASGPRREAPIPSGEARLHLNSWPSSVVYVDGRRVDGKTPLRDVPVSPGRHELRFERPELNMTKTIEIEVGAGGERTVVVKLER